MRKVLIPYSPRKWAMEFHESGKRWIVLVVHRRAGKTVATINHLQRDALRTPESRFAYIAPYFKQAKNIAWDILKKYARSVPGVKFNESELSVLYPNGSKIQLYGADNPDALRGIGLWGVVFDEYSQQPSNIFTEVIAPTLADHQGYAIWIGTPKGRNELYRLLIKALENKDGNWYGKVLTVEDTGVLPQTEIDAQQGIMTPDEFMQEYFCSFEAAIKGAYYAEDLQLARKTGRIKTVPIDPLLKVHTVWDIGVGDATAIGFFQRTGNEWRLVDFYENSGVGLPHYIAKLQNLQMEHKWTYGKHFAPHDIAHKEFSTGVSRLETAAKLGINFEIIPKTSIEERINAGRLAFPTLWVDEVRCEKFLDAITAYRKEWDDNRGSFRDKPYHDWTSHAADMYGYAAQVRDKMIDNERKAWKQADYNSPYDYEG